MPKLLSKILKNPTLMTWSSYFIQFGSGVFVLPLILSKFSEIDISFWFLIGTILGMAKLADSGFGPTLVRAVSYYKAGSETLPKNVEEYKKDVRTSSTPNFSGLSELLSTTNVIYTIVSSFLALILLTGGIMIVWNLISLAGHPFYLWFAYGMLVVNSFMTIQTIRWGSFMTGLNFVAEMNGFKSFIGAIKVLLFVILLLLDLKITYLIGVMLVESLVIFLYLRNYVHKWYHKNGIKLKKKWYFNKEIFKSIWPATWKTGGIFWGNYLTTSGNSIIIAQISDVKLIASFLFTQRILMFVRRVSEAPFWANLPIVYNLMAGKNIPLIKKKLSELIFLTLGLLIISLIFTGAFGNSLLSILNIDTRLISTTIFTIMAVSLILEENATIHQGIYTSTNHVPFLIPALVTGVIILGGGFLVVNKFGLIGIILVQIIAQAMVNFWYPVWLSFKLVKWDLPSYLHDVIKNGSLLISRNIKMVAVKIQAK